MPAIEHVLFNNDNFQTLNIMVVQNLDGVGKTKISSMRILQCSSFGTLLTMGPGFAIQALLV